MTNGFVNSGNRMSAMPTGAPGLMPRRSSYAAVLSGTASTTFSAHQQPARSGAFAHLLNQASDFGNDPLQQYGRGSRQSVDMDSARNGGNPGGASNSWGANGQLPFYSRAFADLVNTYGYDGYGGGGFEYFFVPSYLKGSRYAQSLEVAHREKIAAARENQSRDSFQVGSLSTSSSSANLPAKMAPSHRGVTYDLIEKAPLAENEGIPPLPSKWNTNDKYGGLEVLSDGYEVKFTGSKPSTEREHEAYSIRADHAMPTQCGIYYFEVTIMSRKREESSIGIGFSTKEVPLSRLPGWEPNSWAYHGDDGHSFCCQSSGKSYGPTFTTDDVIGCGVNFSNGSVFFTKNGNHLGVAFREVRGKLFPSVGMKRPGEHVRVNFGQSPFVFDIDGMVSDLHNGNSDAVRAAVEQEVDEAKVAFQREKTKIQEQVAATSTEKLAPPLDENSLIQSLVLQYLAHDGYVETAKSFAQEVHSEKQALSLDRNAPVQGFEFREDEDALHRQQIRNSIIEGDVDRALKLTRTHYPDVLQDNENIYFRLQCHKFIEMNRRAAEIRMNAMNSNGHDGDLNDAINNHDMEVDNPAESNGFDKMDTDGPSSAQSEYNNLLKEIIKYGRDLKVEYGHNPRREVQRTLEETFGLVAWEDPMSAPEVAYLMRPQRRVEVGEELNSAILVSQGKSSSAAVERLIKQTTVLVEDLSEDSGPGCYVNISEYMKPHPPPRRF